MKTRLTEREALEMSLALWRDIAEHGYRYKDESDYFVEFKDYGDCALCYYYQGIEQCTDRCRDSNCPLVSCFERGAYYFAWEDNPDIEARKKYAGIIADIIERRLDAVKKNGGGNK
jgi:hypothetical protein